MPKKKYIITEKSELDNKEYINKRADIVAEVTGTDIDIKVDSTQNDSYCYLDGNNGKEPKCTCNIPDHLTFEEVENDSTLDAHYDIDINCPLHYPDIVKKYCIVLGKTGGVPTKTLAYHELSHILHESLSTTIFDKQVYGRASVESKLMNLGLKSTKVHVHSKHQREVIDMVLGQQKIIDDCTEIYNATYDICMDNKFFRFNTSIGRLVWLGETVPACERVEEIHGKITDRLDDDYERIHNNRLRGAVFELTTQQPRHLPLYSREECSRFIATLNVKNYVRDIVMGTAGLTTDCMLSAFNVLEDQRIESLTAMIWLGTAKMFTSAKDKLGKLLVEPSKHANQGRNELDPVTALLSERFGVMDKMIDIVSNNSDDLGLTDTDIDTIKESLHMCEGVSKEIPLRVIQTKLKPIIFEFIVKQMLINSTKRKEDNMLEAEGLSSFLDNALTKECRPKDDQLQQDEYDKDHQAEVDSYESKMNEYDNKRYSIGNKLPNEHGTNENGGTTFNGEFLSRSDEQGATNDWDWRKYVRVDDPSVPKGREEIDMDSVSNNEEITKEELGDSKNTATTQMQALKEVLTGEGDSKEPVHIKRFPRTKAPYNLDLSVVSSMAHILRELKEKFRPKLAETGDEVDIDAYIDLKNSGHGSPYIEPTNVKGLDIFITIDGSGSMSGIEIDTARNMCANFFKMAEQLNDIHVKANVWSGNSEGDVCITPIETLADCQMITTSVECPADVSRYNQNYYSTPTHEGVKYSVERFRTMNSKNKLFILITDGFPAHTTKGYDIPFEIMVKKVNHELTKARRMPNVSVLTIMLGDKNHSWEEYMWRMYKDTWIGLKDMSKAKQFIEKQVRRKINEVFRV